MDGALVVFSTFGSAGEARSVCHTLVEERLAACANLLPGASIYHWQGRVEEAAETLAILKTTRAQYPRLEERLRALHSYELPEIVALPVEAGLAGYLAWVQIHCAPASLPPPG